MRRTDRQMPLERSMELLASGEYGVLSVVDGDGLPYGIPLNYYFSREDNAIYFHTAKEGRKMEALLANPQVHFVVIPRNEIAQDLYTTHYESVMAQGVASILEDPEEVREQLHRLCRHLVPDALYRLEEVIDKYSTVAVVKIALTQVTGKWNREQ